ncbi:hypothetical protein CKA32_000803 [Geitlerinema sp. FC II]|nr:hypothetical protein CKA32_000803 [Geitlerinema sp. FC II]
MSFIRSQSEGSDRVVLQACYDLGSKLQGGEAIARPIAIARLERSTVGESFWHSRKTVRRVGSQSDRMPHARPRASPIGVGRSNRGGCQIIDL